MSSIGCSRLPFEIILIIAEHLWSITERDENGDGLMARQRRMTNFCLVSHEWYTAGIALLYLCPELRAANSLDRFVDTVTQSGDANHLNIDFGSMIHVLKMGHLDHDIPDMLLERLLSRLQSNLISFEAPPTPFGIEGLTTLSMCKNVEQLDLTLLTDKHRTEDCFTFPDLKQAISGLPNLVTVSLPLKMAIVDTDDSIGDWPASLRSIKIGGTLDPQVMRRFQWPSHPFKLTIRNCQNLRAATLEGILDNENIHEYLVRLYITRSNTMMFQDAPTGILYKLRNLMHLRIPLDCTEDFFMLPPPEPSMSIRVLELTEPYSGQVLKEFTQQLFQALNLNLCNVLALGMCELPNNLWNSQFSPISTKLRRRVQRSPPADLEGIENCGLYAMD
ncbi:uncharacterized protein N7498_003811 [Penicillium cinerascens]|uniref:F-box domain-containing protein n=1 Tax=Penicillium cinerascens TaxID=70096 RepID=A0A9W9T888_9EURO|nr:uncharacterized protein N7498_003811 [Penicillium cinerascens]KAJ5212165.1 hypothetical protein N7498_003811 [Penicillium cinerascens]